MSQIHRRSRNGVSSTRVQPSILKNRKRKISDNELDSDFIHSKEAKLDKVTGSPSGMPLEDVTSASLNITKNTINVPREKVHTPDKTPDEWLRFRSLTCYPTPQARRKVSFPSFSWADREHVWELMCRKDSLYKKDQTYLMKHPALQPRMRAILLDWLAEVCEVYKLHRETYYLAIDYIDRYLTATYCVPKQQLQLLGISCLFIAAKIEEIYPPKLSEFSYVTDGACSDPEILDMELIVVKTLNWDLNPITSISWLNTFLQLLYHYQQGRNKEIVNQDDDFIFPSYSGVEFVNIARQLDLCMLDVSSLKFSASKLAATALCHLVSFTLATLVSGYTSHDLQECWDWMTPFAYTLQGTEPAELKVFNQISADDIHNIQTHVVDLEILEKAQLNMSHFDSFRQSPPMVQTLVETLTPPKTDEKLKIVPD